MPEMFGEREHRRQLGVDTRRPLRAGQLISRLATFHVSIFMIRRKIAARNASVDRADRPVGVAAELQVHTRNLFANPLCRNELGWCFRRCFRRCFRLSLRHDRSALSLLSLMSVARPSGWRWSTSKNHTLAIKWAGKFWVLLRS